MKTKKKFNMRAFASAGLIISGLSMPFTGLMNHLTGFDGITASRHFWMTVHIIPCILFTIFSFIHIILNRHSIWNYINLFKKAITKKEVVLAFSIVIFITALFASHTFLVR